MRFETSIWGNLSDPHWEPWLGELGNTPHQKGLKTRAIEPEETTRRAVYIESDDTETKDGVLTGRAVSSDTTPNGTERLDQLGWLGCQRDTLLTTLMLVIVSEDKEKDINTPLDI